MEKRISVNDAIDKFYKRNKRKLDIMFGDERSAKSHLRNDVEDLPASYFRDPKRATRIFNDYLDRLDNPTKYELRLAKREAIANNPEIYANYRELNKKIDSRDLKSYNKYLGVFDGYDVNVEEYYEIKNSDYVLAHNRYWNGSTEYYKWEFTDRTLL